MPLKDIFSKLKTSIVGTKTKDIDTKLDKAIKDISAYRSQASRNGYIELVRSLIAKTSQVDLQPSFFATSSSPAALGQGGRLMRYKSYEAIVGNINYCHRALNVLADNILSPDDITKTSLEVKSKKVTQDDVQAEAKVSRVRDVIRALKLEERLDIIVKNTLKFGDFFCEIADTKTALTSKSLLMEHYRGYRESFETGTREKLNVEVSLNSKEKQQVKIILDYSSDTDTEEKKVDMKDLHLLFYEPRRVVKLQSDMFPLCFGYLVFPEAVISPHLAIQNQVVNSICQSILKSLEKKIPQIEDDIFNDKELRDIISAVIAESDFSRALSIRFVPPHKMVHFMVPSTKYYPYGESIFDATQFTSKVLIALETALTIHRINRSTEKRKITVEVGLPRDAKTAIEKLKEEFRKRKVSIDSFGTVDTIPSTITTFEDVYIPQKDGKPYVDIATFNEGMVDVRSKVDELRFMRDSIVASLGVPPAFLGLEENLSNKAALAEENILFARTIVNHQKYLGAQITELLRKTFDLIDPDNSSTIFEEVDVAFSIPRSLQFERESKYMSDLSNLVQTLSTLGIPTDWAKKKYLPNIDWAEVKKAEIDSKIDQTLGTEPPEGMGGGGGMGGLGGALPPTGPGLV